MADWVTSDDWNAPVVVTLVTAGAVIALTAPVLVNAVALTDLIGTPLVRLVSAAVPRASVMATRSDADRRR
jgi:hypothetical protein